MPESMADSAGQSRDSFEATDGLRSISDEIRV